MTKIMEEMDFSVKITRKRGITKEVICMEGEETLPTSCAGSP